MTHTAQWNIATHARHPIFRSASRLVQRAPPEARTCAGQGNSAGTPALHQVKTDLSACFFSIHEICGEICLCYPYQPVGPTSCDTTDRQVARRPFPNREDTNPYRIACCSKWFLQPLIVRWGCSLLKTRDLLRDMAWMLQNVNTRLLHTKKLRIQQTNCSNLYRGLCKFSIRCAPRSS